MADAPVYRCTVCHAVYSANERFCPRDAGAIALEADALDPRIGMKLADRYLVRRLLGRGGMGVVYEADHIGLDKQVAIKFLATHHADREVLARFRREARIASKISHEHVVQVFDIGTADADTDYIVIEYVDGTNLDDLVQDEGPLAASRVVAIARQVLAGLRAIHQAGIVHRDIKPANLIVTKRDANTDFVKIMDFGISKPLQGTDVTEAGKVIGTPEYMAPEQLREQDVDQRADLFALGITMIEMLTGARPDSETIPETVPSSLRSVLRKATASNRDERFADARAFSEALDAIDPTELGDTSIAPPIGRRTKTAATRAARPAAKTPTTRTRRRWDILIGASAVAVIGTIGVIAVMRSRNSSSCAVDPALFAGRWDATQRDAFEKRFANQPSAAKLLATFDDQRHAIESELVATCRANLPAEQAKQRESCLQRRALELGGQVSLMSIPSDATASQLDQFTQYLIDPHDCATMTATAMHATHAQIAPLYEHMFQAVPADPKAAIELAKIEKEATALGEQELEMAAALFLGMREVTHDDFDAADAAFQRAYRRAFDLHALRYAALALIDRTLLANHRNDVGAARDYGRLALDLVDKPGLSPQLRARLCLAAAQAEEAVGSYAAASTLLDKGLAILGPTNHRYPFDEAEIRFASVNALIAVNRPADAVRVAKANVELVKTELGSQTSLYAIALNQLSEAMGRNGQAAEGLPYRREALAVMTQVVPEENSGLTAQRADLAANLANAGQFDESLALITRVVDEAEHNPQLKGELPVFRGNLAQTMFSLGRYDDGLHKLEQALEDMISTFGKDHPSTLELRATLVAWSIEANHLAGIDRHLTALEQGYRTHAETATKFVARLHGTSSARLAIVRGKPKDAEVAARASLDAWTELGGTDADRADLLHTLGLALIAQKRFADAIEPLQQERALGEAQHMREDRMASADAYLAKIDAALGKRQAAVERAKQAKAILDRYPENVWAKHEATAIAGR